MRRPSITYVAAQSARALFAFLLFACAHGCPGYVELPLALWLPTCRSLAKEDGCQGYLNQPEQHEGVLGCSSQPPCISLLNGGRWFAEPPLPIVSSALSLWALLATATIARVSTRGFACLIRAVVVHPWLLGSHAVPHKHAELALDVLRCPE